MILGFEETEKLLRKYKIPIVEEKIIKTDAEAFLFAEKFGFPVVLKISSLKILHKTDVGGVILNIQDRKSLSLAFNKINKLAKSTKADILIQKQEKGREIIMGAKRDITFGPIIMFGLGGIFAEVLKDISFRLAPIGKFEARKMIKEIRGYRILKGYRGGEPVNLEKIASILVNLSELILKERKIKEIDLNPVIVNEKKAVIIDAKMIT